MLDTQAHAQAQGQAQQAHTRTKQQEQDKTPLFYTFNQILLYLSRQLFPEDFQCHQHQNMKYWKKQEGN
jgi:hypothetical protein